MYVCRDTDTNRLGRAEGRLERSMNPGAVKLHLRRELVVFLPPQSKNEEYAPIWSTGEAELEEHCHSVRKKRRRHLSINAQAEIVQLIVEGACAWNMALELAIYAFTTRLAK